MTVLILDFGSQYTQLIARRVREARVYSEVHPCSLTVDAIRAMAPSAIILSGGPSSVDDEHAPTWDPKLFELNLPVLGICYREQLIAHALGGKVERAPHREYGEATVTIRRAEGIFARFKVGEKISAWMSHGDRVVALPEGFEPLADSANSPFAAVGSKSRKIYGLQFHAEVAHTERGKDVIEGFLFDVAKVPATWTPSLWVQDAISAVAKRVAADEHAICGLSGGVDSSVAAAICAKALGSRLTCIFVDHGLLRANEREEVDATFRDRVKLIVVDAKAEFLSGLRGVTDPETKRKIIGRLFIDVFDREARKVSGAKYLVQGTLYPDVIESVSTKGPSAVIKSHHNVGGLPEKMNLKLIEPLRQLFKDEVREGGKLLEIPAEILGRHPFPGPGLAIRCLGEITEARLTTLREADRIYMEELRKAGLYNEIWQAFAALLPVRSVGVMGDQRTYEETCALRAVTSTDGMTADWYPIPHEVLRQISSRITNEVRGINRVVFDISSKPPATIEWE